MATFTSAQITSIARILATNSEALSFHLDMYAETITEDDKTAVLADVTSHVAIETDFTDFKPTESNQGFSLSAGARKSQLRQNIANLLNWPLATGGGARLVRS